MDLELQPTADVPPLKLPDPRPRKSQMPKLLIFEGERIYSFSDAVFSIVATVMVIPMKITQAEQNELSYPKGQFLLTDWLSSWNFIRKFITYLFVYSIVVQSWYLHNKFTKMIELFDDILAWLNLIYLLSVSFLPAAISMIYFFQDSHAILTISICNILVINLIMLFMVLIASHQKTFIHQNLLQSHDYIYLKVLMYLPLFISCILGMIAIVLAWTTLDVMGYCFFFSMAVIPVATNIALSVTDRKWAKGRVNDELRALLVHNIISVNRLIAFSDGVFSIVATLLVLDIATSQIPTIAVESNGDPLKFLENSQNEIFSYLATFFIVGLLWFVHHSMVQHFKVVSGWLTVFNSMSLFFIGLVPLGAELISQFSADELAASNTENETTAIQAFSILLIFASVSQLILWTAVQYNRKKYLTYSTASRHVEAVMLMKLLIFPTLGFVFYIISFSESITVFRFFIYSSLVTPVLFILPRVIIMIKNSIKRLNKTNPQKTKNSSSHVDNHSTEEHCSGEKNVGNSNQKSKVNKSTV